MRKVAKVSSIAFTLLAIKSIIFVLKIFLKNENWVFLIKIILKN